MTRQDGVLFLACVAIAIDAQTLAGIAHSLIVRGQFLGKKVVGGASWCTHSRLAHTQAWLASRSTRPKANPVRFWI